jgi:hypothetical protein
MVTELSGPHTSQRVTPGGDKVVNASRAILRYVLVRPD